MEECQARQAPPGFAGGEEGAARGKQCRGEPGAMQRWCLSPGVAKLPELSENHATLWGGGWRACGAKGPIVAVILCVFLQRAWVSFNSESSLRTGPYTR